MTGATADAATSLTATLTALHRRTRPGERVRVVLPPPERLDRQLLADIAVGAGFTVRRRMSHGESTLTREWTLPDTVAPGMRLLVCGLNPSPAAADAGVGFARPGNRFWPAALAAGLVTVDRDPDHALRTHGLGMTDLVKRTTRRADELSVAEFAEGTDRLHRLALRLQPRAICMVGLAGWRAAVDRAARPGWQDTRVGSTPVYVMPSTSGLNASAQLPELTRHLATAAGPHRPR